MSGINKKYKETEFGPIPKEWQVLDFGNLFEFKNGVNASKELYGKGVKFINVMEVIYNNFITSEKIPGNVQISDKQLEVYSVKRGDILFNRTSETTNEVGLSAVYLDDENVVFGGFVIRARPKNKLIDDDYKKYCFQPKYVRDQIVKSGQGAVRSNIGQSDLEKVQIILPPLEEQKRIARILGVWDKAIENTRKYISVKERIKKDLEKNLLNGTKRFSEFKSRAWKEVSLHEAAWFQEGPGLRKWQFKKEGIKVINITNIVDGILNLSLTDRHISWEEFNKTYKHFAIDAGDIVIASSGNSYGKHGIVRECDLPLVMNTSVIRFKPKENCEYEFLNQFLKSPFLKKQIDVLITGGAQPNFGPFHLGEITIPLPEKDEQKKIAFVLSTCDKEINDLKVQLNKLEEQKQGLMQVLLTGKKKVKINSK